MSSQPPLQESETVELKRTLAELKEGLVSIVEKEPGVTFIEMAQMFITRFERPSFKAASEEAVPKKRRTTQETTQEKIMACLKAEPTLTRKLLAQRVGISEDGAKYHLNKLKVAGAIRHVGATKAGWWEVLGGNGEGDEE